MTNLTPPPGGRPVQVGTRHAQALIDRLVATLPGIDPALPPLLRTIWYVIETNDDQGARRRLDIDTPCTTIRFAADGLGGNVFEIRTGAGIRLRIEAWPNGRDVAHDPAFAADVDTAARVHAQQRAALLGEEPV